MSKICSYSLPGSVVILTVVVGATVVEVGVTLVVGATVVEVGVTLVKIMVCVNV